jgi:hypothetical protein
MLLLQLRIDGDSRGAQRAADDTRRSLTQLGQESRKPAGNPLQPIEDGAGRAGNSVGSLRMIFKTMAREAALLGGPMAGIIGQVGTLTVGTGRLGLFMTSSTIAIAAIAAVTYKAITAFSDLEQHNVKVAASLGATKVASGQTVAGLEAMTRELARSGTQTVSDIRDSEVALLRFKSVSGDTFGTVLRLARDAASGGFAPMKDATIAIGKALADPTKATEALRDIGLSLSVTQQRLATDFYNTGQRAKAQQVVLTALFEQIGGTDTKAADTLSAAGGRLTKTLGTYFEQLGGWIEKQGGLKAILDATATAWDNAAAGRFKFNTNLFGLPPAAEPAALPKGDRQAGPSFASRFDQSTADIAGASGPMRERQERIKAVTDALLEEARTAGLNATQQRVYNEQVKAGALTQEQLEKGLLGTSAAAREVAASVQAIGNKNFARDLTAESIKQESALRVETATVTMSTGAAAAYRFEQEKIADAKARGVVLSDQNRDALKREAGTIGDLTQRLDDLRTIKSTGAEVTSSLFKDFRNELQNGATAWDAFKSAGLNALNRVSDKLIDMAANNLWNKALGGSTGGGGLLGILGSLFGGGSSQPVGVVGGAGDMVVPTFDSGGFTGNLSPRAIAGVVHGGEFVFDAPTTARNRSLFDAIHAGRVPGYASGGYVGGYVGPASSPSLAPWSGGGGAPIVHVHPAAPGETFDARVNDDGSLALVGRMVDEKISDFSRRVLPTRVHAINADPRAR